MVTLPLRGTLSGSLYRGPMQRKARCASAVLMSVSVLLVCSRWWLWGRHRAPAEIGVRSRMEWYARIGCRARHIDQMWVFGECLGDEPRMLARKIFAADQPIIAN